jgi:small subunit ribosomal protein S15
MNSNKLSQEKYTGSPEFLISLFTKKIRHLSQHLKLNKKDNSSRMGLLRLVGKKKKIIIIS